MANKYNSKLTEAVSEKICEAIIKGHSIRAACGYVDITEPTFYSWYKRGEEAKSGKYRQFYCDVNNAKSKATMKVEQPIIDAIPSDIATAKWWLVKHNPDLYGDRQYNETKIDATVESDVTLNLLDRVKEKRQELNDLTND